MSWNVFFSRTNIIHSVGIFICQIVTNIFKENAVNGSDSEIYSDCNPDEHSGKKMRCPQTALVSSHSVVHVNLSGCCHLRETRKQTWDFQNRRRKSVPLSSQRRTLTTFWGESTFSDLYLGEVSNMLGSDFYTYSSILAYRARSDH